MGAGSTKPGQPGQRPVQAFEHSQSSSDEPTETFGMDSPPPQRRSPPRRKKAPHGGEGGAAAAASARRGAASSSRRSAAAAAAAAAAPGPDTRAASAADLSNQLDELDATFTSLGIVGRQLGGSSSSSPGSLQSSQSSGQLQQQLHETPSPQQQLQQSGGSSGSRCSRERRRTQPFSWEERSSSQQENWNYQKVSLDGFDPEKFKKANKGARYDGDIRIGTGYGAARANIAVPEYDHQDQQILASIERDFDKLIPL